MGLNAEGKTWTGRRRVARVGAVRRRTRRRGEPPPGGDSVPGRAVVLKYARCHQPPRWADGRGARVTGSSYWGLNRASSSSSP